MAWADVASRIATVVGGVAGITGGAGKVLLYLPDFHREEEYDALKGSSGDINAWTITREGGREVQKETGERTGRTHNAVIRGYAPHVPPGDVSEPAFQALVDLVLDALAASTDVHADQPESGPIEYSWFIALGKLGAKPCHITEIRFAVDEFAVVAS